MPKINEAKLPIKKTSENSPPKKDTPVKGFSPQVFGDREILYPDIKVQKGYGEQALTFETVKKLLGWSESPNPELPNEPWLFKLPAELGGKPIWCHNVITKTYRNRFITWANVLALKQEHLRKRWKPNGETLIVGKSGFILNGQHQSIAFCLACLEWNAFPEDWNNWDKEPTMEKLVVFGIEEDDDTVNSMDTAKPRSLVEVIERSEIFASMKSSDRKECAKLTDHAVRLLWHRLGVKLDAFAPRRTHSEAMDFIGNHPKLLKCVKHIFDENSDHAIIDILTPGYASALMYLMTCSNTQPEDYHNADSFSESNANLENFDKACEFFVLISENSADILPLKNYKDSLKVDRLDTRDARIAIVVKAWLLFIQGKSITQEGLRLDFSTEDGVQRLAECPTTGGIDRGNPKDDLTEDEPTEDEIKEHQAEEAKIKAEKNQKKAAEGNNGFKVKSSKKNSQPVEVGDTVWVKDSDDDGGGTWDGELIEIYEAQGKPVGKVKSHGTGKVFDAPIERMSHTEPI